MTATTLDVTRLRQEQFPITRTWSFLNHATYGPLPAAHVQAASHFVQQMSEEMLGDLTDHWIGKVDEVRAQAGQLINCEPDAIALLKNTTEGLCLVPLGLDWREGDEVITYQLEFPSNVYPWMNLASQGVKVKFIGDRGGRFDVDEVESLITPRTRAVNLSMVNFANGFRAPVEAIGELCQERGIWFVVDAIQALGALKVDAQSLNADIISAHGYKFLLSGFGISVCYCSRRARSELRVPQPGWKSIAASGAITNMLNYNLDFPDTARRFESGVQSLAAVHGLSATLELLLGVGQELIDERVLQLAQELAEGLESQGFAVMSSQRPGERSGIVSARRDDIDVPEIQRTLAEEHVSCAIREGRVRISPHFYNTAEEVEKCLSCLPK